MFINHWCLKTHGFPLLTRGTRMGTLLLLCRPMTRMHPAESRHRRVPIHTKQLGTDVTHSWAIILSPLDAKSVIKQVHMKLWWTSHPKYQSSGFYDRGTSSRTNQLNWRQLEGASDLNLLISMLAWAVMNYNASVAPVGDGLQAPGCGVHKTLLMAKTKDWQ